MSSGTSRLSGLLLIILACAVMLGCSNSPVTPTDTQVQENISSSAPTESPHSLAGYYLLSYDTETGDLDVIPLRTAEVHLNMVGVLNSTMGVSVAGVPSEHDPPNGIFVFDVTLTHPFETKSQFSGFDVKGIFITDGDKVIDGLNFADLNDTRLLNADGYTRWWNPTEFTKPGIFGFTEGRLAIPGNYFTATCNPYKLFADRLGTNDELAWVTDEPLDSDIGRSVFRAGESNTRRYRIQFKMSPGPQIYFGYAIDVSWAMPDPNPPNEIPDDFPIEANQPEAYRIALINYINTLYYDSESGYGGGTIDIKVNVHDWQGQESGDFTSEIGTVDLFSPGLGLDNENVNLVGWDAYRARYRRAFNNLAPTSNDQIQLFCSASSTDGSTYKQAGAPAPEEPLKAWQVITLDIVDPPCEADSNNSMGEAVELVDEEPVTGALCGGTDSTDWYKFVIPLGNLFTGSIGIHCSLPNTTYTLGDEEGNVIESGDLEEWTWIGSYGKNLTGGTYYIRITTTQPDMAGLYVVNPDIDMDPIVPDSPEDVTPGNLSMDANWVHVMGNYVFMANHYFVWVWDISDEYNPVFVSRVRVDSTSDPAFYYPYMYLVDYDGVEWTTVKMIDFTDVTNPVLDDFLSTTNTRYVHALAGADTLYFAALDETDWEIEMFDYQSNPSQPDYIGYFDIPDSWTRDLRIMYPGTGNESLIVLQNWGLYAYNVSDPVTAYLVDNIDVTPGITSNYFMAISGEYIAKINYNNIGSQYNLVLYRYTGGLSLDSQSSINLPSGYVPTAMDAYGTWVIVGSYSGVNEDNKVYDFSNPANIQYNSSFQTRSRCSALHHDQYTLVAMQEYYAPRFVDITGFVGPGSWRETFKAVNYPTGSVLLGDYMYLGCNHGTAHHLGGINLESVPDAWVRYMRSMSYDLDFFCGNDRICAWTRNLDQIYFALPSEGALTDEGYFNLPQDVTSIAVSDEYMYVVLKNPSVMKVYNTILFPDSDPTELPDVSISPAVQNLIVQGEAMYGFDLDTMFIYNLAVPDTPAQAGLYAGAYNIINRLIYEDWLFLLYSSTLTVLDISDPLNPVFETSIILPYGSMKHITRMEQYLIVGDTDHQPVFIDITDPASPVIYGEPITDDVTWQISGLVADNEYLYVLNESYGVRIYDMY